MTKAKEARAIAQKAILEKAEKLAVQEFAAAERIVQEGDSVYNQILRKITVESESGELMAEISADSTDVNKISAAACRHCFTRLGREGFAVDLVWAPSGDEDALTMSNPKASQMYFAETERPCIGRLLIKRIHITW